MSTDTSEKKEAGKQAERLNKELRNDDNVTGSGDVCTGDQGDVRIRMGRFETNEEHEKWREKVKRTKLP